MTTQNVSFGSGVFRKIGIRSDGFEEIFTHVWKAIPHEERLAIEANLGILHGVPRSYLSSDLQTAMERGGGKTELFHGLCKVVIDTSQSREDVQKALARELAHVLLGHPAKRTDEGLAEREAVAKAKEWGFARRTG
jgi:hypothetical protein